jgi:hypothetical protein
VASEHRREPLHPIRELAAHTHSCSTFASEEPLRPTR